MAEYPSKGLPEGSGLGLAITSMLLQHRSSVPQLEENLAMLAYSQKRGTCSWGSAITARESSYPKNLDNSSNYEEWKRQWEKKTSGYEDWKRRWEARLNKKTR